MDAAALFQKLCRVEIRIRRLLLIKGIVVVVVFQFLALNSLDNDRNSKNELTFEKDVTLDKRLAVRNFTSKNGSSDQLRNIELRHGSPQQVENLNTNIMLGGDRKAGTDLNLEEDRNRASFGSQPLFTLEISSKGIENLNPDSTIPTIFDASNSSTMGSVNQGIETQFKNKNVELLQTVSSKGMRKRSVISLSQMYSLLVQSVISSSSIRPRWPSARDRELLSAKLQIENAPIVRSSTKLYAPLYRNVSMFIRSYELMERVLKVYIYREGGKPIFHESRMDGIYASEGWFIKLMEGNKHFVVKDPRKAHLFYLPFSSKRLRIMVADEQNLRSWKIMALDEQNFLDNYVDVIAAKHLFWNRTEGADHFLVACHDWAPRITKHRMKNCIRALCNSNAGIDRGFKFGKDTSLPETNVMGRNPLRNLGGKPAAERSTLAFFAGQMHGSLRPILLQYWENKVADMKIFGPTPRDTYKEYMKSSKYCICAKGTDVHSPRVVEAILYECVPVILADNYVPPFFEVLDWESFAVFVQEEDIPNLRNILLSIPEEKYFAMQSRVKMVQQHFLWHQKPVKYDLFHMILHSVWYIRVFQMNTR